MKLTVGQELLLWPWITVLCDYRLDLVLRDSLYHLHSDAFVNLIEQAVNAIGSSRSRVEINLEHMWDLRLSHIVEEMINKQKNYGLLDSLIVESYLVCASSL